MEPRELSEGAKFGVQLEYNTLRAEILQRINMRQQIVSITLTIAGAFLAFGVNTPAVALVYPLLALFLAYGWAQNDFRIRDLGTYLREQIEKGYPELGLGWESTMQAERGKPATQHSSLSAWRYTVLSHGGAIIVTQLVAVLIGISPLLGLAPSTDFGWAEWILLLIDLIAMLQVFNLLRAAQR